MNVETDLSGHTVLVVDDNAVNLSVIADFLEVFDLNVLTAIDGQDALEIVRQIARPDLILLDVVMPELDGFEVCRRLKAEETTKDIPVIFMTVLAETEHKVRGFEVGGVDYVTKPVQPQEVLARVRTHLALRAAQRQLDARNKQLEREIAKRKSEVLAKVQAEAALQEQQEALQKAAELARTSNASLEAGIAERKQVEAALRESEARYRRLFENSPISLWEEDFSQGKAYFDRLRASGVTDWRAYFTAHPEAVAHCAGLVKVLDVNAATLDLLRARTKEELLVGLPTFFTQESFKVFQEELCALAEGQQTFESEAIHQTLTGEEIFVALRMSVAPGYEHSLGKVLVSLLDITRRKQMEQEKDELLAEVSRSRQALRTMAARLAETQEFERKQLARELHERVGQNLSTMGFILNIIRDQVCHLVPKTESKAVLTRVDDALDLVKQTTDDVRSVMAELRPPVLDDYGLAATLRWYGEQFSQRVGIPVTVQGDDLAARLPALVENTLFRITQEALTNVARHAQATQVTITLAAADEILLAIADNGVGFDPTQVSPPSQKGGWGLLNIAERAVSVGGECRVESTPGQGTNVVVRVKR